MSRLYIARSPIHGTGVFSASRFSPGEIVLKIDDSRFVTDAAPLDPTRGEFEHHCDYLSGGQVVLMQTPERFINQSCDPNAYIRTMKSLTSVDRVTRRGSSWSMRHRYSLDSHTDPTGKPTLPQ